MSEKSYKKVRDNNGILPNAHEEAMNPDRMRIKDSGLKMAKQNGFFREGTVSDMKQAMPVGNGDFGALIHGMPDNYFIRIAKNDLWWDDYPDEKTWVDYGIEGIREKLLKGDVSVNNDVMNASARRDHRPIQTCAAELTLHLLSGTVFYNVNEELDISEGRASTLFSASECNGDYCGDFAISTVADRFNDVLITRVDASKSRAISLGTVRMELTRPIFEPYNETASEFSELHKEQIKELDENYQAVPFADDDFWGITVRLRRGKDPKNSPDFRYTVMMTTTSDKFKAVPVFHSAMVEGRPEGNFSIFTTVVSSYDAKDTVSEAKRRLMHVKSLKNENIVTWWSRFWNSSWIKLPEDYAKPWYWGLYEAASARRQGKAAHGYNAPWHSENYVTWGYHILTYEAAKANLGLFSANHCDLIEPWCALLRRSQGKLREFTSSFYKMPGVCYPHAISNEGNIISSVPALNSTLMNMFTTGEALKSVWEYYEFTKDIDYLRDVAYPLLRESAVFCDAYLLDKDGRKVIFPSRIQEYHGEPDSLDNFTENSIQDVAQFKFVLNSAANAAEILNADAELCEKWRLSAKLLGDYATYPDGVWKVSENWSDRTEDYGPRSVSDLSPIAITGEVDAWHGQNEKQIEQGGKTVRDIMKDDLFGWDLSFGIIANMRYGNREAAKKVISELYNRQNGGNLDIYEPSHSFYVDKGSAYHSEIITEMLLQSQSGEIRVFPAYPFEIGDAAFFSLRARNAFLVSSEVRDGKIAYIIIKSLSGENCRVYNELGDEVRVRNLETDEIIDVKPDDRGVIEFMTTADYEYVFERKSQPLEAIPYI